MTAISSPFWSLRALVRARPAEAQARTDPPVKRRAPPVFIHDAITPWRGETMLLHQLRQDAEARDED